MERSTFFCGPVTLITLAVSTELPVLPLLSARVKKSSEITGMRNAESAV
jgi:hypothetical protein